MRCIAAIEHFQELYASKRWAELALAKGPIDLIIRREQVAINARLDCQIFKTLGDETVTGGVILFYANTLESQKNIDERRRQVASLVHWALEENGQMEPQPSLCMSFGIFGASAVKSPDAKDRFRDAVDQSCREAALKWDSIEPPSGYDGPDWR